MSRIYRNLTELIGHTPLMEVQNIGQAEDLKARVLVKIEAFRVLTGYKVSVPVSCPRTSTLRWWTKFSP